MRWYVSRKGKIKGPFPKGEIIAAIEAGKIGLDDTFCQEGSEEWLPMRELGAFASAAAAASPVEAVEQTGSTPARRQAEPPAGQPGFIATLFDLSFKRFVMVDIVRWLYVASIATAALTFIVLIVSGLQSQPRRVFAQMGLQRENGSLHFAANFEEALEIAADLPDPDPQA